MNDKKQKDSIESSKRILSAHDQLNGSNDVITGKSFTPDDTPARKHNTIGLESKNNKTKKYTSLKKVVIVLICIISIIGVIYCVVDFVYLGNVRMDNIWRARLSKLSALTIVNKQVTVAKSNPPNHDPIDGDRGRIDDIYAAADFKITGSLDELSSQVENNLSGQGYNSIDGLKASNLGRVETAIQGYSNGEDYIIVKYSFSNLICTGRTCRNLNPNWKIFNPINRQLMSEPVNNIRAELVSKNRYIGQLNGVIYDDYTLIETN